MRYTHLAPGRQAEAVERLVGSTDTPTSTSTFTAQSQSLQVVEKFGSGARTRTGDLGIMRPSLCRLSYAAPEEADVKGSNQLTISSSSR